MAKLFLTYSAFCLVALLVGSHLFAPTEFSGRVVSVLDGDPLEVLNGHQTERIRLYGIDRPEKGQPYGKKAKQALSALTFRKTVMVHEHGYDQYKRTIGDVLLADGTNVNHELVKDGWCWWYQKFAPGDRVLEGLEKDARKGKKGLWADPKPTPPSEWRKQH